MKNCTFHDYLHTYLQKGKKSDEYNELIETHDRFHKLVAKLLKHYKEGKMIKEGLYDEAFNCHHKLIGILTEINNSFEFVKNQMDTLTQCWNRKMFVELIKTEHSKSKRKQSDFCLAFFDIDHFKMINDKFGHECGDFVLQHVIELTRHNLREYDSIGRWGGEEFIILLPETSLTQANEIIERVKSAIEQELFIYKKNIIRVTASFGISTFQEKRSYKEMIRTADMLMYEAKKAGRNRIFSE